MRPVVHLEVFVPLIRLPLPQASAATSDIQSASDKTEGEQEAEVRVLPFNASQSVEQASQVELPTSQPQKKRFQLFQIPNLPEMAGPFRLQIWRRSKHKALPQPLPAVSLSDEIAFDLDFIQLEETEQPVEASINTAIYQVKLYLNPEGMLIGYQIDNSDN